MRHLNGNIVLLLKGSGPYCIDGIGLVSRYHVTALTSVVHFPFDGPMDSKMYDYNHE